METTANFHLLRPRFFRQVQFYLAGVSFRYRNFFVLPGQSEGAMDFVAEIRPLDGGHSSFGRVGGDAVLSFASSSVFQPPNRDSDELTPSEVIWAPTDVIRPGSSLVYLSRRQRDNFLRSFLVDCCRRISGIGHLVCANVKR